MKNILICKIGSLGDVVRTTPNFESFERKYFLGNFKKRRKNLLLQRKI